MECQQCGVGWQLLDQDHYCGYCGHPTYSLSIQHTPTYLYAEQAQPILHISLINDGSFPLHILELFFPPCWKPESNFTKRLLQPQEKYSIQAKQAQPLGSQTNNLFQVHVQEIKEPVSQTIAVLPLPKLSLQNELLRFGLQTEMVEKKSAQEDKDSSEAIVEPEQEDTSHTLLWKVEEAPFELLHAHSLDPWWTVVTTTSQKTTYAVNDTFSLHIQLHPEHLRREGRFEGRVILQLGSSHEKLTIEATFFVLVQAKPQVSIREIPPPGYLYSYPSHLEESPALELHIQVRGEKGFSIDSLKPYTSDNIPAFQLLCTLPAVSKPASKNKQKSDSNTNEETFWEVNIPFKLLRHGRTNPANYDLKLVLRCDPYGTIEKSVHVTFVESQKLLVGIDFGTSNTCAAYITTAKEGSASSVPSNEPSFHRYQMINEEILPTLLFYYGVQEMTAPQKTNFLFEIGPQAKTLQVSSRKKIEFFNFVQSIKRKLGTPHKTYLRFSNTDKTYSLFSKDMAKDYLQKILLDISKKGIIEHLFVTHPTRFSELQVQELREAIGHCGYPRVGLIDEASATAYYHVQTQYEAAKKERKKLETVFEKDFRLIVYDFGGGTTDITVSQVQIDTEQDSIVMQTLAAGGIKALGGEDVTEQIIRKLLLPKIQDQIKTQLKGKMQRAENIEISYSNPTERSLLEHNGLLLQSISLYEMAEGLKITLSEKEMYRSPNRTSSFYYKDHRGNLQQSDDFDWEFSLSRKEFNNAIKELLMRGIEYLEAMLQGYGLQLAPTDLLLLAGQSSRIQLLQSLIKERLTCRVELLPPSKLKHSVAEGACHYGRINISPEKSALQLKTFSGITRFSYAILRRSPIRGDFFQEQIAQFSPLDTRYQIQALPLGTLLELYQNATPWIKDPSKADADRIGSFYISEETFNQDDPKECDWFIEIDALERISLLIEKKEGVRVVWAARFACETTAY